MAKKKREKPKFNTLLQEEEEPIIPPAKKPATPKRKSESTKKAEPVSGKPKVIQPIIIPRAVVNLQENRNLSKKARESLEVWNGRQRGKALDGFFARQAEEARKKFGHEGVYLGSQAETMVIGIPCPALAFEFVIAQDCFPLGLVMQIVAKHGVGKSGLLAEFGRWIDMAGGGMVLCENETKFNPLWYTSILGPEAYNRMLLHRCNSVEEWQRRLTSSLRSVKRDMIGTKEAPGPGRSFPVLFGVDSIMGKMSEENQEKIVGKVASKGKKGVVGVGFAQARSFPIEAGSISKYMRTVPQLMDRWPFALVLINHLRIKKDENGNDERNKTGGEQVNFQESFELEIKKIGGHAKRIQSVNFEGSLVQISCEKNSFGPTGRRAQTRMLWWHEKDENGLQVQKTVWDWDWATVHLLHSMRNGAGSNVYLKNRLKDTGFHIDCPKSSDVENTAWCKSLGMTERDAQDWSTVGALIREDVKLMNTLRDALCISRRPLLKGDYLTQLEGLAEEMP